MATTLIGRRPSTLAAARVPSVLANAAQVCVLGRDGVVPVHVRTAPIFGQIQAEKVTLKINKYMGTFAAAAAERAATTVLPSSAMWAQRADKVKGGDARGIPPRGLPV